MILKIPDILAACPQVNNNAHLYIYQNGRQFKLFEKGKQEKNYKILHALTILKELNKQTGEFSNLTPDDAKKLTQYVERIKLKKTHSSFINFLSKLHNIILFKGTQTSRELAEKILQKFPSQEPLRKNLSPDSVETPSVEIPLESMPQNEVVEPIRQKLSTLFTQNTPKSCYLRKTQKKCIEDFVTIHFLTNQSNQAKNITQTNKTPLMTLLYKELQEKGYPFVDENLADIHEQALNFYIDEHVKSNARKWTQDKTIIKDLHPVVDKIFKDIAHQFPHIANSNVEAKQKLKDAVLQKLQNHAGTWESKVRDRVIVFLEPYIQGKITPQNESPFREPLQSVIKNTFSHLTLNSSEITEADIMKVAVEAYFFESVHGLDLFLNKSTFAFTSSDSLSMRKKAKNHTPLPDNDEIRLKLLNALEPALQRDFPSTPFDEETILKNIDIALNQYRLSQIEALHEVFESLVQIELIEMVKLKKLISTIFIDGYKYNIMENEKEFDLFQQEDGSYYPIFKHSNRYYKALLPQSKKQIAFVAGPGITPVVNDSFKFFGIKIFQENRGYSLLDKEGQLTPLSQEKFDQLCSLPYNHTSQLLGGNLYNLPTKNEELLASLSTILR